MVIVKYSPYPGRTCALEALVMVGAVSEAAYEAAGASETPSTANVATVAALATLCRRRRNGGWPFAFVLIFMLSSSLDLFPRTAPPSQHWPPVAVSGAFPNGRQA